jgi:hypothetical protein
MRQLALILVIASTAATAAPWGPPEAQRRYYFERRQSIIRDFLGNVAGDKSITARFSKPELRELDALLADQFCTDPCTYEKAAHPDLRLTPNEVYALVRDLRTALAKFKATRPEQDEMIGALEHGLSVPPPPVK